MIEVPPPSPVLTVEPVPLAVLTEVTIRLDRRSGRSKLGFAVDVCKEGFCCRTNAMYKRNGGVYKFSERLSNLGSCRTEKFTMDADENVHVRAIMISNEPNSLEVMMIRAEFDDGRFFTAQEETLGDWTWSGWEWTQQMEPRPLSWGQLLDTTVTQQEVHTPLPPASCPRQDENACPRQNVIAHRRKADARKSCYYQE